MNPSSEDIKDVLLDSNLSLVFGANLFIGKQPNQPDQCVTIYDTPGFAPQMNFNQQERYNYPSIQIRVRAVTYLIGYQVINDIKMILHGVAQQIINETTYTVVQCMGDPSFLEWDEKGRVNFIINFNLQRR